MLRITARLFWLASLLIPFAAAFSQSEKRFDFFCLDGQHVRNAEIDHETEQGFYVRLPYLKDLIFVDRDNLSEPPVPIQNKKKDEKQPAPATKRPLGKWKFGLVGNYTYSSLMISPLGEIFTPTSVFSAGTFVVLPRPWLYFIDGFHAFGSYQRYVNEPRYIEIIGGYVGTRLAWWNFERFSLKIITELSVGMASVDMKGFTFTKKNLSAMVNGMTGISFNPGAFYLSAGVAVDYVQDSDVMFSPLGVTLRVGFTF